mgnify:CR=1 FL=1
MTLFSLEYLICDYHKVFVQESYWRSNGVEETKNEAQGVHDEERRVVVSCV